MCEADYFTVRLPGELKPWLQASAEKYTRSINGQVVHLLKEIKQAEERATKPPAAEKTQ